MPTTEQQIIDAIDRAVQNGMDAADGDPNSPVYYECTAMSLLMIADEEHIDLEGNAQAQQIIAEGKTS